MFALSPHNVILVHIISAHEPLITWWLPLLHGHLYYNVHYCGVTCPLLCGVTCPLLWGDVSITLWGDLPITLWGDMSIIVG